MMSLHKNFVAENWVEGSSTRLNIISSDNNDIVGEYALADQVQTTQAIDAACDSQSMWAKATAKHGSDASDRIGTEILARRDELGVLLSREESKTLPEGIGEVVRAGRVLKFLAVEALRLAGEKLPSIREGVDVEVPREPEGVVGFITPWNFPIAIPAWKIAPALAYGNAVVFVPADLAPGSAWVLSEIIVRAGQSPRGVFNAVMGPGSKVGQTLVSSCRVRAISLTGSVQTGRAIGMSCMERAAKFQMKMGGKNPLVILKDANLEQAVSVVIRGSFYSTGQRCTGSSRLVVEDGIHDGFVAAMKLRMDCLKVDHALKSGTDIGPVASAICVKNDEEAVDTANDTDFGLSSGISTTSLKRATDFKRRSTAGMVMGNVPTAGVDDHAPFGGRRGSGYVAREQGVCQREFYTAAKTAHTLA